MNKKLGWMIVMATFAIAPSVFAKDHCGSTDCEQEIQDLKNEVKDLKDIIKHLQNSSPVRDCASAAQNSQLGTRCQTSTGAVFVRVDYGWKDTETKGKVWYDDMAKNLNQYSSKKLCSDKGQALPSKEDFQIAESHGFREILKDMKNRWFWSSSIYPYYTAFAYGFYGSDGNFDDDARYSLGFARCVGR